MMICSRRLYKGNAYDICLPLADSGVTLVRFYTRGDVIVEKEPEISGDSMCFSFTEEDLASLEDGVLRYEVVTDYETTDTNSPFVVVTPVDYSGSTLEDLLEDAYNSGYTAGYESGYTDGQEECGHDYSRDYFTIEALEDGQLNVYTYCEYSINDGDWESFEEVPATLFLEQGDKVRFRGYLESAEYMFSGNTIMSKVYGNIESLAYGDDFVGEDECLHAERMFNVYSGLVDASNLVLPATSVTYACYLRMFAICENLVSAPALPATELDRECYCEMFVCCRNLATAPELPATTLALACYKSMFQECESLVVAPELPATTLAVSCYEYMFLGDKNLNDIKCLATDMSATNCLIGWVAGVSPTGTFVKAPGVTWPTGHSGIPTGWTVIEAE